MESFRSCAVILISCSTGSLYRSGLRFGREFSPSKTECRKINIENNNAAVGGGVFVEAPWANPGKAFRDCFGDVFDGDSGLKRNETKVIGNRATCFGANFASQAQSVSLGLSPPSAQLDQKTARISTTLLDMFRSTMLCGSQFHGVAFSDISYVVQLLCECRSEDTG